MCYIKEKWLNERAIQREPHAWNWIHWNYRIVKMWASANIVNENKTHIRVSLCAIIIDDRRHWIVFAASFVRQTNAFFSRCFVSWSVRSFIHSFILCVYSLAHAFFAERSLFRCIYIFMSFHKIGFEMFIEMLFLRSQYFRIIY